MKSIVYHYCDLNTLHSILKNKSLWLSDVKKSNDSEDGNFLLNRIHGYLKFLLQTKNKSKTEINNILELLDTYFEAETTRSFNLEYSENNKPVYEQLGCIPDEEYDCDKFEKPLYAICFSSERDLLSQWRGYAGDGIGVAIGFRTDILSRWNADLDYSLGTRKLAGFAPVTYTGIDVKIADYAEELIEIAGNYRRAKELINKRIFQTAIFEKIERIREESILLKNEAFSEEKEYRLFFNDTVIRDEYGIFHLEDEGKKLHKIEEFKLSGIKTRVNKEGIVSYYEWNFDNVKDDIIVEIVLGPKCKLSQSDLEFLLSINGFNSIGDNQFNQQKIIISKSNLTYR